MLFAFIIAAMGSRGGDVLVTAAIMFVILLGFGWFFDNMLHRYRLRRWMEKHGSGSAGRR